jgi:ABC-2 type transport system permease protein
MSDLEPIYRMWLREIIRYWRDKGRIVSSLVQTLLFLAIFGAGFGFIKLGTVNYQTFLFPGIVAMGIVTMAITSGISVIWDREFGFLKEVLVAPVNRLSIFFGKAIGGCTIALFQGIILMSLSFLIGISISLNVFLISLALMVIIALGIVSVGLIIASLVQTIENFGVIMNFIVFPLIFLSGGLFPLQDAPSWLKIVSYFDPLTYGVDALRQVIVNVSFLPFWVSFTVLCVFSLGVILIGGIAFNKQD